MFFFWTLRICFFQIHFSFLKTNKKLMYIFSLLFSFTMWYEKRIFQNQISFKETMKNAWLEWQETSRTKKSPTIFSFQIRWLKLLLIDNNLQNIFLGCLGIEHNAINLEGVLWNPPLGLISTLSKSASSSLLVVKLLLKTAVSLFVILFVFVTIAARACSTKRICTITLSGSSWFCAAFLLASTDSFLQSKILHNLFLSILSIFWWTWKHTGCEI